MPEDTVPYRNIRLSIALMHIEPPIWRRLLVPADVTLVLLHDVIQVSMGWQRYHLHEFRIEDIRYGTPLEDDLDAGSRLEPEQSTRLDQVVDHVGQRFSYVYDFGDNWEHEIVVEEILSTTSDKRGAYCLGGARCCPPEDVGGPFSYPEFLEALSDPSHENHEHYTEWAGGEFDPEHFDPVSVNEQLEFMSAYWESGVNPSSLRH
jgi:hypothetical protein